MPKRKRGLLKQPCNSSRVSSSTVVTKPRDEEDGVSIWVQCENESCQKWRQISTEEAKDLEDSAWYCWLNRDSRYNTCSAEEQKAKKPKHMKFIYSLLPLGEVVIAKLSGYPPWVLNRPYSYSQYWTEKDFKCKWQLSFFMIFPCVRLHGKLDPVQCRGYQYGAPIVLLLVVTCFSFTWSTFCWWRRGNNG